MIVFKNFRTIFDVGYGNIDRQRADALSSPLERRRCWRATTTETASKFTGNQTGHSRQDDDRPSINWSSSAAAATHSPSAGQRQSAALSFTGRSVGHGRRDAWSRRAHLERDSRTQSFFQFASSFTTATALPWRRWGRIAERPGRTISSR